MEVKVYEGKNIEETLEKIKNDINLDENKFIYRIENKKVSLLKKNYVKLYVYLIEDIQDRTKKILKEILNDMGLESQFESKIRENQIEIKIFSNNNSILIGKEGRTLQALSTIIRQIIYNEISIYPNIYLDVENYKEKQQEKLERLAKRLAREVDKTGIEVKMDNMNAYERRIVHNALSNNNKVITVSEGEEPNRHVIIKKKED